MSEIEKSFTFLRDNIPQWLQDMGVMEAKVAAMQDEIARVPISVSPFAKRPTESIESIRPGRMCVIAEEAAPSQGAQTDPVGNRKRKTLSVMSGRASGPSRYRARTMVVVSYDGDMQKSFELMVRAIGTGRNLLRKAKMEAKMNELAALAGSSEDEDEAGEDEDDAILAKVTYRPRMSSMRMRTAAQRRGHAGVGDRSNAPVALFDTTDKMMEHAQGLCEKAAHLTLRDGDCRKELGHIRKSFEDVLESAKTEAAKCRVAKSPEPQEAPSQDTSDTSVSSAEPSYKRHFPQFVVPPSTSLTPPKDSVPSDPPATMAPLTTMEIEVDDDEDDDEPEFVMPPVRLTSRIGR
ncbi:hypothetical protein EK21DRAFT_110934 [Setomelanomma holmii]|uniref:Uncharacterized protein n=1 Tax=Setomelanomma holmii TaxID=210430 RepID=A0A9P4HC68_9PLEO|nr:hypothetical protein EK21DRAFT_110934 [Setomelanomma holmii]